MAERVEIRGGDLDGSILDNAATEATLLRLVGLMEKSTGSSSGSGSSSSSSRLQDMYNRSLGQSNKGLSSAAKSSSALGDSFNKAKSTITETTGVIGNLLGKTFGAALTGASFAVNGLKDFLVSSYTEFKSLSETGAAFNNNMIEASQQALSTGMSLNDFTGLITKNNTVLTSLGGTATEGARRLSRLSDEIRTGDVGESLFGLGMTTNDINDYLGSYLEQQQRLGSLQRKDDAQLRQGTKLYVEELDKLSKLTGIERKKLDEEAKKQSLDPVLNLLKRGLSEEELAKSTANLAGAAQLGGQELQDAIKEIATGVIRSPLARNLVRTGALTQDAAQGLVKGQLDIVDVLQETGRILDSRNELNSKELLQGNEDLNKTAALRDRLIKIDAARQKAAEKEASQRNALTTAFGRFPAILDNIRNKVFGAFLNSTFFQKTIDFLNYTADSINEFINKIDFNKLIVNFLGIMDNAFNSVSNAVSPMFNKISEFFKTIIDTLNFDNIKDLISTVFNKIANVFKNITNSINFDKIGNLIGNVFNKVTNLFKNVASSIDFDKIGNMVSNVFNKITNFFSTAFNGIDFDKITEVVQRIFGSAINTFNDVLEKFVYPMIEKATGIMQKIAPKIGPIIEDFGTVIVGIFDFITSTVIPILQPIGNLILDSIEPVITILGGSMKVLKGIFTGNFSVAMDGMSQMFQGISDQIKVITDTFKGVWNALGVAFEKMGDFFSAVPLYIEKYIADIPVLGKLAQKSGLVRSVEDVDKELQKKIAEDKARETARVTEQKTETGKNKTDLTQPNDNLRSKLLKLDSEEVKRIQEAHRSAILAGNNVALASAMTAPTTTSVGTMTTQSLAQLTPDQTKQTSIETQKGTAQVAQLFPTPEDAQNFVKALGPEMVVALQSSQNEQTKQLNTLVEQLLAVNKQQLEANQDLVKATKGSYNPI